MYLKFEPLNFVPFEKNLINECLLTNEQVDWLNKYNLDTRNHIMPKLDDPNIKEYLLMKTEQFKYSHTYSHCPTYQKSFSPMKFDARNFFIIILFNLALIKIIR